MSEFTDLAREQRLWIIGARIHELEGRTSSFTSPELDKLARLEEIMWKIIERREFTDQEWNDFCLGEKMHKYLKTLKDYRE